MENQAPCRRPHVSECPLPEVPESAVFAASYIATPPAGAHHAALTPALTGFFAAANALCAAARPGAYASPTFHYTPQGGVRYMLSAHAAGNGGIIAMTHMHESPDAALYMLAQLLHLPYPLVLEIETTTPQAA